VVGDLLGVFDGAAVLQVGGGDPMSQRSGRISILAEQMETHGLVFLGICERAAHVQDVYTNLHKWNILGLKPVVLSHIYPFSLAGMSVGFAVAASGVGVHHRLRLVDASGNELSTLQVGLEAATPDVTPITPGENPSLLHIDSGWIIVFAPLQDGVIVLRPGWCEVQPLPSSPPAARGCAREGRLSGASNPAALRQAGICEPCSAHAA
jgi:hypothetical protein